MADYPTSQKKTARKRKLRLDQDVMKPKPGLSHRNHEIKLPNVRIVQVFSPVVVKVEACNFSSLVQRLTGKSDGLDQRFSSVDDDFHELNSKFAAFQNQGRPSNGCSSPCSTIVSQSPISDHLTEEESSPYEQWVLPYLGRFVGSFPAELADAVLDPERCSSSCVSEEASLLLDPDRVPNVGNCISFADVMTEGRLSLGETDYEDDVAHVSSKGILQEEDLAWVETL